MEHILTMLNYLEMITVLYGCNGMCCTELSVEYNKISNNNFFSMNKNADRPNEAKPDR